MRVERDPAAWVVEGLRGFGQSVLSVVPAGFAAYARILHPAYLHGNRVRWAEIAAAYGRRTSSAMQWCGLTGGHEAAVPGRFDEPPRTGALPLGTAATTVAVLREHTTTPQRCWFAIWEGWGGLPPQIAARPGFDAPARRYHLLSGPVDELPVDPPASLWWPDDHAWCVATEIDLDSTYVGGADDCVRDLLAAGDLESVRADPGDGIGYDADPYNEPPPTR